MIAPALGPSLKKGLEMSILGVIMLNGYQLNSTLKSKVITLAMDTHFLWKEAIGDAEANYAVLDSSNSITMESHSHLSDDPKRMIQSRML
jgi:hypothetical protein